MTVRFAPARRRNPFMAVVRRNLSSARVWTAANDNLPRAANDEALLAETLRHFGAYGLRAAEQAAERARAAHDEGNEAAVTRWLSICAMFDARLARKLGRKLLPGK